MMEFSGTVMSGDGIGKTLGFPTINIFTEEIFSETGVFSVHIQFLHDPQKFVGILHLGPRPTLQKSEKRVEIFVLNFSKTVLNGTMVKVSMGKKIRDVQKFDSLDDLKIQIQKDIEMI